MKKQLCIGLSLSPTWIQHEQLNDSELQALYQPEFYVDLAKRAEAELLDFVFKPDSLVMANPNTQGSKHLPKMGSLDPTLLLASISTHTHYIGLVSTLSTTFVPPYLLARQIQSLHQLSNGRAGWNVVTSLDGAAAFGMDSMPETAQRYARANEVVDVVMQLWNSYSVSADKTEINPVNYKGNHIKLNAVLNVPKYVNARPALFQAGASNIGRDFAASIADAVFAATPDIEIAKELKSDLQQRSMTVTKLNPLQEKQTEQKQKSSVKVLPGLYFFMAKTREEAWQLHANTHASISRERRLSALTSLLGIDLSSWDDADMVSMDTIETMLKQNTNQLRSQTHSNLLFKLIAKKPQALGELLKRPEVVNSGHWVVVGTVDDVVTEIKDWFEAGAMDGFIALPGGSQTCCDLFFDEVMPKLRKVGLARQNYSGKTLMAHLYSK